MEGHPSPKVNRPDPGPQKCQAEYELAFGVLSSLWKWPGVDHSVQGSCREHVYDPSHVSVPFGGRKSCCPNQKTKGQEPEGAVPTSQLEIRPSAGLFQEALARSQAGCN